MRGWLRSRGIPVDDGLAAGVVGAGLVGAVLLWPRESEASLVDEFSPDGDAPPPPDPQNVLTGPAAEAIYRDKQYPPFARTTEALFMSAARAINAPLDWATDPGLHQILHKESDGWVGRPNYQFGELAKISRQADWWMVWDAIRRNAWRQMLADQYANGPRDKQSSATGLGQLTVTNIDRKGPDGVHGLYYPSGRVGIGVALEEAIGMLAYIRDRYQTPALAWSSYGRGHEGY